MSNSCIHFQEFEEKIEMKKKMMISYWFVVVHSSVVFSNGGFGGEIVFGRFWNSFHNI